MISSKVKPKLFESDCGNEFYKNIFQNCLNNINIKIYSRNRYLGAVFAERFIRTIRDLLQRPIFEKGDGNCIDVLPTKTKQYKKQLHTSFNLTPIQASLKKSEGYVYNNLLDKMKRTNPKFKIHDLVRVSDLKKTFLKDDTTNWSYRLFKITEIIKDTKPGCKNDNLKER